MTTAGAKYVAVCPESCSLHASKIGDHVAAVLLSMRENGAGGPTMAKRASELLNRPVPSTNMQRHVKHYREVVADEAQPETGPRPNDLAILDAIIGAGYRNSRNWKPTIKDTLDAMKLKVQMTGQSAFEDMLAAMEAGLDLAEEGGEENEEEEAPEVENPEAVLSPDERVAEDE